MRGRPHHGADHDGQVVGVAVNERTDAYVNQFVIHTGRAKACDKRRKMGLMSIHAVQQLGRDVEGLGGSGGRPKLIDTHQIALLHGIPALHSNG
ncbi:hypothetical protein EAH76_15365 [Sphingomonas glacialis]|uniref:Uncharacterized protein n=1 Tax=Sphingomonas glacialis TaxID=658225 RepID=A0A502FS37_9SPHN|nr:hypothetical protein EAH76_15365 [Sphingomonas glacialis]